MKKKKLKNRDFLILLIIAVCFISIIYNFLLYIPQIKKADDEIKTISSAIETVEDTQIETTDNISIADNIVETDEKISTIHNKELIARIIFAEAGNQPYVGKLMVAATIKNRSEQWWFTPEEIVCAEGQYAKPYDLSKITTARQQQQYVDCLKAIDEVFSNDNTYDNVLYFCNPKLSNPNALSWMQTKQFVVTIGDHSFYKEGQANG